jgi:predicted dehydrogenase
MIKIGIIGMGNHIGIAQNHIKAYLEHPETEIVGLYDIDSNQCVKYKENFKLTNAIIYKNLDDILDNVDAISICTPNNTHTKIASRAIDKGVHVLCEKPFSTNIDTLKPLIKKTLNTDLINMVGFCYRGLPCYKYIKEKIEDDFFGQIYYVKMSMGGGRIASKSVKREWRMDSEKSGSGALADFGSHLFDMIDYLLSDKIGKICQIQTQRETFIHERIGEISNEMESVDNDDVALFIAKSEKNTLINLTASRLGATHVLEIYGEKGYIAFDANQEDKLIVNSKTPDEPQAMGTERISIPKEYCLINGKRPDNLFELAFFDEISSFVESIKTGTNNNRDFSRGLYIQYLLDQSLLSAQTNKIMKIDRSK